MPKSRHSVVRPKHEGYLKIGDVAQLVDLSPSLLRSWEKLGLTHPRRSRSRYRLYSQADVRILKRARYLRRVRGLNAPAIVELLRQGGLLGRAGNNLHSGTPAIGRRLRGLRLEKKLSLATVASAVRVSVGFLSALERSQMSASVGTLRKIAGFYKLNILDFFNVPDHDQSLVRPKHRKRLQAGPGVNLELLAWGNTVMEPHLFHVAPGAGSGDSYSHEGEEFLFVLDGQLDISVAGKPFALHPGDSFYFQSKIPHRWGNPGKKEAKVLWINTPPTF